MSLVFCLSDSIFIFFVGQQLLDCYVQIALPLYIIFACILHMFKAALLVWCLSVACFASLVCFFTSAIALVAWYACGGMMVMLACCIYRILLLALFELDCCMRSDQIKCLYSACVAHFLLYVQTCILCVSYMCPPQLEQLLIVCICNTSGIITPNNIVPSVVDVHQDACLLKWVWKVIMF